MYEITQVWYDLRTHYALPTVALKSSKRIALALIPWQCGPTPSPEPKRGVVLRYGWPLRVF